LKVKIAERLISLEALLYITIFQSDVISRISIEIYIVILYKEKNNILKNINEINKNRYLAIDIGNNWM
jgi:phage-related protein